MLAKWNRGGVERSEAALATQENEIEAAPSAQSMLERAALPIRASWKRVMAEEEAFAEAEAKASEGPESDKKESPLVAGILKLRKTKPMASVTKMAAEKSDEPSWWERDLKVAGRRSA